MGMTNTGTTLLPLLMPESTSVIGPDCGLDLCSPCIDWHFQCRYAKSSGTCFHGEIYSRANDLKYPVSAQQIAGPFQTGPSKQIVFLCLPKFVSKKASKTPSDRLLCKGPLHCAPLLWPRPCAFFDSFPGDVGGWLRRSGLANSDHRWKNSVNIDDGWRSTIRWLSLLGWKS